MVRGRRHLCAELHTADYIIGRSSLPIHSFLAEARCLGAIPPTIHMRVSGR